MAELESVIEEKLIHQLCSDSSQWTHRPDIRSEEQLWSNFKYILEQNNKAALDDTPLSDQEFAKIKNDVSHASFYDAGKWLVGEFGKVQVHIQRGNKQIHLTVLNNEHVAGGTSVYEVINQYQAFKTDDDDRNRRFDVTLLINGLPMIHIELKNKDHSYIEGFNQIKKYIAEGKFRGLFSNIQMFVVSNAVDTRYFAAARDTELNKKFLSGWLDQDNKPVTDYLDFARYVLKIPEAHEMVAKYTVLDNDKKQLLILRPYQIHAIDSMRAASKRGISGYIWHTTGSGKTMTSYKATRNLLMDIPALDKTVFLIDRKDLDEQTKMAFQSYADNDTIEVDDTDNVEKLKSRLADDNRQMIVTTRQKLQILITKRLKESDPKYKKIKFLKVAFVVDECHRAVTPRTKRELDRFFNNSLWYGFTGTPIFEENKYEQMGDLPQTTEQLYGKCLHSYTIKEAIHDEAVLGFMVENLGSKIGSEDPRVFETDTHMRSVLNVVLNQSYTKLGMQNGRGRTYEGLLTCSSIPVAQKYYSLLKKVASGEDELKISEDMKKALPDFPKFAITYSVSENEERSAVDQQKMKESIKDYNDMFGTNYSIENINAYNTNLNDRLARKDSKYKSRDQQLDLVIVVDRLLTGFDAPCLSTIFIDRQPMSPQNIIQAFSRTNRLFEYQKQFGQIVTFQAPEEFKDAINDALVLYSRGGDGKPVAEDWEAVLKSFITSLGALRGLVPSPGDIPGLSRKEKKIFVRLFISLDHDFAHLKAFSRYTPSVLAEHHFSEAEYEDYAAMYKNVVAELKTDDYPDPDDQSEPEIRDDYELVAFHKLKVDFEYIVELLQGVVEYIRQQDTDYDEAEFERKIKQIREIIDEYAGDNPKRSKLLTEIVDEIEKDRDKYKGQDIDISVMLNKMRTEAVDKELDHFARKWFVDIEDVRYEVLHYRNGELANESKFKDSADYAAYKETTADPLNKLRFRSAMIADFKDKLMPEIAPLL